MRVISIIILVYLLAGCATSTITGKRMPAIPVDNVHVWFSGRPNCNLEEIAFISSPYAIGQSMMVNKMREEAASLGAEHLIIQTVNSNRNMEYSGGAIAAHCI